MTEKKHWLGSTPKWCDICEEMVDWVGNKQWFVDGQMKSRGSWAIMCPRCFEMYGVGLGLGKGQKYSCQPPYEKLGG